MVVWGVVSSEIEQVIEFFRTRREAERMLAEVVRDEPNWQERFYIERIELGSESRSATARGRRRSRRCVP